MTQRRFREETKQAIRNGSPLEFARDRLFGEQSFLFYGRNERERRFFEEIARALDTNVESLILVGSGKIGFSLNPQNLFRPFLPSSDLDLVIVDEVRFDQCWLEMIARTQEFYLAGADEKRLHRQTLQSIQNGYIRSDRLPITSMLAMDWFPRFAGPFESEELRRHDVSGWLFRTREHAVQHYAAHISRLDFGGLR